MGSTDKAQTCPRQINDWLTEVCEPLSWCCWQLCQEFAAAKLSCCSPSRETAFCWKTSHGQNLRAVLQLFLQGPDPAQECGEIMIKRVCGEGSCWGRAVLQSQAVQGYPEPRAAENTGGSLGVLGAGKGAQFWGNRKYLFVAPCSSLGCQKNFSGLQGGGLRHWPILLAIALGSDWVTERGCSRNSTHLLPRWNNICL